MPRLFKKRLLADSVIVSLIKNSFEGGSLGAILCRSSGDSMWVEMLAAVDQESGEDGQREEGHGGCTCTVYSSFA